MKSIRVLMLAAVVAGALTAQVPTVNQGGVLNGASYSTTNPPGSLIVIFGTNMTSQAGVLLRASSTPLSMSLQKGSDDISVKINGKSAPMYYASTTQTSVQLPWGVPDGNVDIVVTRNGTPSAAQQMQVGQFSPGIFTVTQNGQGMALAFNGIPITVNGKAALAIAQPAGSVPGLPTVPAKVGDHLFVYCTGLGAVTPSIADGAAPCALSGCKTTDKQRTTITKPKVLVGGVSAHVEFSGLAPQFVGVYQLNFQVPAGVPTGNAVPIQIQIGGASSRDGVTIAVQ